MKFPRPHNYDIKKCKCGGEGILDMEQISPFVFLHIVRCRKCKKKTFPQQTEKSAIEKWNKKNG